MLRYQEETVTRKEQVLKEVICDRCGQQLIEGDGTQIFDGIEIENTPANLLPASFSADFGYFNKHDGEKWTAELCEQCAEAVLNFINDAPGPGVQIQEYS